MRPLSFSLLLLLTCCLANQARAQRRHRTRGTIVCHIGIEGAPYSSSDEIALPSTGRAELLARATQWAIRVKAAEAPAIQLIPDTLAATTTVETAGTWPLTYTLNGMRTTIPLHFTALVTPSSDSTYSYHFSQFDLLVPDAPEPAAYLMYPRYKGRLPESLREALDYGFSEACESLKAELLAAMSHPLAKTTKVP